MLKQLAVVEDGVFVLPAAFGRLCVETTIFKLKSRFGNQPPSGGCVLKLRFDRRACSRIFPSRLRAAVC